MLILAALPVSLVALKTQQIFRNQAAAPKSSPRGTPVNPIPAALGYHAVIGDGPQNYIRQLYGSSESDRLRIDGPMTVEAWVNFSQTGATPASESIKTLISLEYPGGENSPTPRGFIYKLDLEKHASGDQIVWHKEDRVTNTEYTQTASSIQNPQLRYFAPNTWYHIETVYSQGQARIFVNGQLQVSSGDVLPIPSTRTIEFRGYNLKVGVSKAISGYDLRVEELRISNVERNVSQLFSAGTYNSPLIQVSTTDPKYPYTVGLWHFESVGSYTDYSGRQNPLNGMGTIKFEPHLDTPAPPTPWKVEYYNNPRFIGNDGRTPFKNPKVTENIIYKGNDGKEIDGIWARYGSSAPTPGIVKDRFSVVWTKNFNFKAGTYKFNAFVDDYATIKVNNQSTPVVDKGARSEYGNKTFNYTFTSDGTYPIVVQYRDERGSARLDLTWTKLP